MSESQPALRRQLGFVKRQAGLVILVTLVAIAAAAAASTTQEKVYRASTKIVVGQGGGFLQPQFGNVFQPFTQTMSSLLKSDIVANTVIDDLQLDETPKSLLSHVDVSNTPDSAVLQVSFDSHNREEAVRILSDVASVFTALVRQKLGRAQESTSQPNSPTTITATVFDPAHASTTPVSPRPVRTTAFAGIIGLVLGIVLGLLREALDDRLRGREELETHFAAPVIATLPKSMLGQVPADATRRPSASFRRGAGRRRRAQQEAVGLLRAQLSRNGTRGTLVVITSTSSGEGKSTVAANLGVALALTGNDVICVDADPTHPRLAQYLEIPEADVKTLDWQGGAPDLSAALREVQIGNGAAAHGAHGHTDRSESRPELDRMNSAVGDRPPGRVRLLTWGNEQDTLAHPSIADLASELKARAGYVIVDTRPLSSGTTLGLLAVADETVIVVREEKTTREQARFARQTLETLQISSYSLVAIGSD